jgi:hypothetical protein
MHYGIAPDSINSIIMTIPKGLSLSAGSLIDLLPFKGIVWEITMVLPIDEQVGAHKQRYRLTTINEW